MPDSPFDLAVIGSGPGGYVCAIRGAQLGLKTALIEKDPYLGGTCLNVGCIPSKALLHSTEMYHFIADQSGSHGIEVEGISIDLKKLMKKKEGVVDTLRKGVQTLVKKRQIEVFQGHGQLLGDGKIAVKKGPESEILTAQNIVLATGSKIAELPFLKFDGETVVSSDEAIAFKNIPEKLVVVGGGAIGLELGSVWNRLGSDVTIVEFLPKIAPTFDDDISRAAERLFKKQGLQIETSAKVTGLQKKAKTTRVTVEKKGQSFELAADKILVAVGRRPYHDGLGLETLGITTNKNGAIHTDERFQTNAPGIYAIGDTTEGPMLAHKAEEEGVAVAEIIAGSHGEVNYEVIPNVIYTEPEIASVGISESEAKKKNIAIKTGKFPLAANGRALASDATDGFIKVIAAAESDRLLGVQIIAHQASELIAAAVTHMEYGGSAEDLGRTIHAHPTLSESLKEAALAVEGVSIHSL